MRYPQWLQGLLEFLAVPPGSVAKVQGSQQWWPDLVGCTHCLWWLGACACVVAGAGCRHTCSGEDQGRQKGPGPAMAFLAAAGTLAVNMLSHDCAISLWVCALQLRLVTGIGLGCAGVQPERLTTGEYDNTD